MCLVVSLLFHQQTFLGQGFIITGSIWAEETLSWRITNISNDQAEVNKTLTLCEVLRLARGPQPHLQSGLKSLLAQYLEGAKIRNNWDCFSPHWMRPIARSHLPCNDVNLIVTIRRGREFCTRRVNKNHNPLNGLREGLQILSWQALCFCGRLS